MLNRTNDHSCSSMLRHLFKTIIVVFIDQLKGSVVNDFNSFLNRNCLPNGLTLTIGTTSAHSVYSCLLKQSRNLFIKRFHLKLICFLGSFIWSCSTVVIFANPPPLPSQVERGHVAKQAICLPLASIDCGEELISFELTPPPHAPSSCSRFVVSNVLFHFHFCLVQKPLLGKTIVSEFINGFNASINVAMGLLSVAILVQFCIVLLLPNKQSTGKTALRVQF